MTRLYAYRMTHDHGFAPNPYGGMMTLATCKPRTRRTAKKGDWIAGFAAKKLIPTVSGGNEHLIYLMQVDKIVSMEDYYNKPEFEVKRYVRDEHDLARRRGDNIYEHDLTIDGDWKQHDNEGHCKVEKKKDTGGKNVLISYEGNFFYFGRESFQIDVLDWVPPRGCGPNYYKAEQVEELIRVVKNKKIKLRDDESLEGMPLPTQWYNGKWDKNGKPCVVKGGKHLGPLIRKPS